MTCVRKVRGSFCEGHFGGLVQMECGIRNSECGIEIHDLCAENEGAGQGGRFCCEENEMPVPDKGHY